MLSVRLDTLDEVVTEAILVLVEVREGATNHRERSMLDERIEQLRRRLRDEYRRRGLLA